jgi:uncharacterized protein (DUF305 family)
MIRIAQTLVLLAALSLPGCRGAGNLEGDGPGEAVSPAGHVATAHAGMDHAGMDHAGMDHAPDDMAGHVHGLEATAGPGYTVADVHFMQMMIGHHDQALRMAVMAPRQGAGSDVLGLAQRIDISQRDEIATMQRWLRERGQPVPDEAQMHAMQMPGMVTADDFVRLEARRGTAFDRLFLTLMINHHVGALDMVDDLFASPGAMQDSELFQFATDVGADQLDEIGIMERILDRLPTP